MKDFLSATGTLTADIGAGWISRYDCGVLAPGDVVRADELAGDPQRVGLNGGYLCDAAIAVMDGRLYARVARLEPETPPPAGPERGEEATELLPFALRLASVQVPLGRLSGIGRLSFIDLEKPHRLDEDAELVVAGLPLAAGKVVVIGERFGLRITRRLAEPFAEAELRTSGAVLDRERCAETIKDYDFLRPDCFTRRGIQRAHAMHVEVLRTLADRLPPAKGFRLALVDQLAYYEWAGDRGSGAWSYALLPTKPAREREEGGPALPREILLRPSAAEGAAADPAAAALRDMALRELRPSGARPVVAAFDERMRGIFDDDPGLSLLAACLRNGWRRAAGLGVAPAAGFSPAVPGDEAAYGHEMILLVGIEAPEGGRLELVYPLRALASCFGALNA